VCRKKKPNFQVSSRLSSKKTDSVLSYAKEMVDVDIEQDRLNKKRSSIKDGLMGAGGDLVLKKK